MIHPKSCFTFLILNLILFTACASVQDYMKKSVKKPDVDFVGTKLTGLSFDAADLQFDLKVTNPNPVGVTLAGFDYDFLLNNNSFLQGQQDEGVQIPSEGENIIQIPLTLRFNDIFQMVKGLANQDSTQYRLDVGVSVDVPVLGTQRIPVSKTGSLPLLRLPKLKVESLQLNKLGFSGADVTLKLGLDNPNALSFLLKNLTYQFEINDRQWLTGTSDKNVQVSANDLSTIEIPFSLNFLQIGQSVYQMLNSDQSLAYHLRGSFDLASSLPLLGEVNLPFDRSGQIPVIK